MKITRYYGDNGKLIRYDIKNEMRTRGARYAQQQKRAQLVEDIKAIGVTFLVMSLLVVWCLINN